MRWSSAYFFMKRGLLLKEVLNEMANDRELCRHELETHLKLAH